MSEEPKQIDRDSLLVEFLASGHPKAVAGRLVGMSSATVRRRLAEPEFTQRVRDRRAELFDETAAALAAGAREAVGCLRHLLTAESETLRLGAARALLELGLRYRDATEIETRLANLESMVEGGQ